MSVLEEELQRLWLQQLCRRVLSGQELGHDQMQFNFRGCQVHADEILAQCNGEYSSSNPLKVTILAPAWSGWSGSPVMRELAKQVAKFPQLKVTLLVPENSWLSDQVKREAQSLYKVNIVKAKKQPGFVDPIEWLNFPPADLSTDIVVGYGEKLGKIAQYWKERSQCKTIQIFGDNFNPGVFSLEDPFESFEKTRKGLCEVADICVATGSEMSEKLSAPLRYKNKNVFDITPGIFSDFCDVKHCSKDGGKFRVLFVGGDNPDDFQEEGLAIAAKAVRELNDKSYHLIYVGTGKETKQQFTNIFQQCGVAKRQLTARSLPKDDEEWKSLFCEVDLAIMPSGEKAFGWEALLALSAGLPVLVHGDSGFGEALKEVKFGKSAIVDSEDAAVWASKIKEVRKTDRKQRLEQAAELRSNYDKMYSWEKQCGALVGLMFMMVSAQEKPEASQVNGQPS